MRVRTKPYADLIDEGGETLLLRSEGGLIRLGPVGAAIVELSANTIDLDALACALERRFGSPDGISAIAAVDAMARELAEQDVVELGEDPAGRPAWGDHPHWRIRHDAAFTQTTPDRVVVLPLRRPGESPRALLGSGAAIWRVLVGGGADLRPWVPEATVLAAVASAHGETVESIRDDTLAFLRHLAEDGLLDVREA